MDAVESRIISRNILTMRSRFNSFLSHSVSRNAFALIILQIVNALLPLLVLPYLTRVLGVDGFGAVSIALALIQLAYVLTDFGFSLSGPFAISKARADKKEVSELIGAVFILKLGLAILASACVIFYGLMSFSSWGAFILYLVAPIAIFGQAFQPFWFFQGIEKMKNVTIYMVIVRCLYALSVFLLVADPADAWLVIFAHGMSHSVGALLAIWRVYAEGYRILYPKRFKLFAVFRESSQYFASRVAVSLYTSASTVLVGSAGGVAQAAQFSVCEQLYKGGQCMTAPINQALYPYMAKNRDWKLFYKIVIGVGSLIALGCLVLSFFSAEILDIFFGKDFQKASVVLIIFLIVNVVNYLGVSFGYPGCSATGSVAFANKSVIYGSIIHVFILSILFAANSVTAFTVSLAILITESSVFFMRFCHILKFIKLKKN